MNTITTTASTSTTILAIDLGKYKSVACVHGAWHALSLRRACRSREGQHALRSTSGRATRRCRRFHNQKSKMDGPVPKHEKCGHYYL